MKNTSVYLGDRIDEDRRFRKGFMSLVAQAIECQPSYLSQVLNGKPHLTLEQSTRLNRFLAHEKSESKYFLLMVQLARAGTKDLQQVFREEIDENERKPS